MFRYPWKSPIFTQPASSLSVINLITILTEIWRTRHQLHYRRNNHKDSLFLLYILLVRSSIFTPISASLLCRRSSFFKELISARYPCVSPGPNVDSCQKRVNDCRGLEPLAFWSIYRWFFYQLDYTTPLNIIRRRCNTKECKVVRLHRSHSDHRFTGIQFVNFGYGTSEGMHQGLNPWLYDDNHGLAFWITDSFFEFIKHEDSWVYSIIIHTWLSSVRSYVRVYFIFYIMYMFYIF